MSKIMYGLGILVAALGIALGVLNFASPGQMQVQGLTPEVAAILLVGGLICLGLGGVISALTSNYSIDGSAVMDDDAALMPASTEIETPVTGSQPKYMGFGRKTAATATAAVAVTTATATTAVLPEVKPPSDSVAETIAALEKAKTDINNALGGSPQVYGEEPVVPTAVEETIDTAAEPDADDEDDTDETATGEGELFVVEEKIIRGRPARVLSDGTVEAETDEGWMRFENLEHLDEYLDATAGDTA